MLGVLHGENYQAVLVDTPGMMTPKTQLHRSMVGAATSEAKQADLVLWLVEATHQPTEEDERVARFAAEVGGYREVWTVLTKIDKEKEGVRDSCLALLPDAKRVVAVSAKTGEGVGELVTAIEASLPEGPPYFPGDQVSEQNDKLWMAEIIREQVLMSTRQEVPHAVAVTVEELREGKSGPDSLYGRAILYVERDSQKGILIGKDGALLKKIGAKARVELEKAWGKPLYLDLWVKVKKDWRDRDDWLRYLGYV
jgi:GTP-binding protein Era